MNAPGARDSEPSLQILDTGQRTVACEVRASTLNCTGDSWQGGGGSKVLTHSALCPPRAASACLLLGSAELVLPSWVTLSRLLDPSARAFPLILELGIWTTREAHPGLQSSLLIITGHLCTCVSYCSKLLSGAGFYPALSGLRLP